MGYYINPQNETKEQWLEREATSSGSIAPKFAHEMPDHLPVCLVTNLFFTAAGIAYSDRELSTFTDPYDPRAKHWYMVETKKLLDICPDLERVVEA